jgi:hypothetical protein
MESSDENPINNIYVLEEAITLFIADNTKEDMTLMISEDLRRPMRHFKTTFPTIFYFAYGTYKVYRLYVSKTIFEIKLDDLHSKTKKIFIDHSGLRINPNNITSEIIDKIRPYYDIDGWLAIFQNALLFVGGEKEFHSKHYDLEKRISDDLKLTPEYNDWKHKVVKHIPCPYKQRPYEGCEPIPIIPKNNASIYNPKNNGSFFVSIDLKSANFQVVKGQGLITENTWKEFIAKYIDCEYFSRIKLLRIKTLSTCNHKKQTIIWQNIILGILDSLIKNNIMEESSIAVFNGDEIIFKVSLVSALKYKDKCISYFQENFPNYQLNVEAFQLVKLNTGNPNHYVKINLDTNAIVFKGVNADELLTAIDYWTNEMSEKNEFQDVDI